MARMSSQCGPIAITLLVLGAVQATAADAPRADEKALVARHGVKIRSTADGSDQDALFAVPEGAQSGAPGEAVPLLVALHTWSSTYALCVKYIGLAQRRGWILVAPDCRGPNTRPEACASALAIQDA